MSFANPSSNVSREQAPALSAAEKRTIGMIAGGVALADVLDELCRTIDVLTSGVISTVLLMDPDGKRLWLGAGPAFPPALKPAINPWWVGPDRGACGTAAFLRQRVVINDVTTDPRWPDEYRTLAVSHGLRASWSQPLITSEGTVLGTFAMYYAEPRVPDAADLELIEAAARIALIAIQLDRSQAAVRESESRFRLVANAIPVMLWTWDADSQWTYINHAWNGFVARADGSPTVIAWAGGIHPDDAPRSIAVWTAAVNERVPFEMEYRLRRHDGTYRWVFDQGVPRFDANGALAGYIGSGIDVTDRKLAEEALSRVSQRLIEAQEHERMRLARELHDDINPRLTLVSMALDRLKHGAGGLRDEIEVASGQLAELVQDIQALSHRLHSSKLDLLGLTRATAALCAESSDLHGVTIDVRTDEVPEHLSPEIALCLFRVLQEALQNATKHSGSREIQVALRSGAREIELTVIDAGVGFDDRVARGRGLGLASMSERLKLVGGELSVDSKPGAGTIVRARVPFDRSQHSPLDTNTLS